MSSILKGLTKEDYTGIESGSNSGPFTAEKTPAINPYGGEKDRQFRGAVDESDEDLKETPNENPTGASGEGGRRWYKPKPAGLDEEELDEKWSAKYKRSINCSHPKGFSQKAHCAGKKKHNESVEMEIICPDCGMCENHVVLDESLHDWFNKEKWVRMDTKGNIKGPCAREPGEGKPKCLPQSKAHNLGKKGRASAASRKRREDPNPERSGKAINVATKKKTNEEHEMCPECGGAMYPDSMINEKKDACYYKVKSRYKVWPSAYASGALVKCRKKGAKNWGTKSESVVNESSKRCEQCGMTNCKCPIGKCKCKPIEGWVPGKGFKKDVKEAANAAQQAAIAIAMKKAGKKPKHVKEYDEKLGAAELPFTNGQLVRLKKIKDRLLGNKYKIINILHGGDRVRIVNQRTGKPLTVRFDDIVSLNENTKPLQSQLATLESGYVQARKATKAIKYLESEVQQIVVQVQQIAKQSGVDMQAFESAATEVSQAFNSLESSVYGLDETFKDQISSIQSQIDDSESLDEDDSDHQFSRKSIKESAESIEKLRKAIMNRILAVDDELFDKYGEVALGRAIDEVSEEYGDNQEQSITDADITAFTKEVLDRVLAKDNKIEEGPSIFSGGYSGGAPRLYKAKPAGLEEDKKKDPPKINKKTGEGIFWTKEGRDAQLADRLGPGAPCIYCGKPGCNHRIHLGKKNPDVTHINPGKKTSAGYDDSEADEWGATFSGMTRAEDHIYTPSPGWKKVTQDEIDFGIRTGVIPEDEYEGKDWEDDIYTRIAKIRERIARVGKKAGHLRVVKELDTWNNAENYKAAPAGLKKESSILKGLKK